MAPDDDDLVADLAFAHRLADAADEVTMRHFRGELRIEQKPDGSFVSDADVATEERLRELITEGRAGDSVLGEEAGLGGTADGVRRRWVLDPIDGTHSYIEGRSGWGTLIALEIDRVPTIGVVSMPATGRRAWGVVGVGAFRRHGDRAVEPIRPRSSAGVELSWTSVPEPDDGDEWHRTSLGDLHTVGPYVPSTAWRTYPALMVAEGSIDVAVQFGARWDVSALIAVVHAAGAATAISPTDDERREVPTVFASLPSFDRARAALGW
ncbi:MAG: inositol monophosphatase family protein [Acidimicrobiales bacterium]